MSKSLLDLMPEEARKRAVERAERRLERRKAQKGLDVSPEFYMAAELGYYFGWESVMAFRRGYTVEPSSGNKELFGMAEAQLLLEGARKVWYRKLIEQTEAGVISNTFNSSSKSFDNAIQPYKERANVE